MITPFNGVILIVLSSCSFAGIRSLWATEFGPHSILEQRLNELKKSRYINLNVHYAKILSIPVARALTGQFWHTR